MHRLALALLILFAASVATAAETVAGRLRISAAYSYETPAPGITAGGYLSIRNTGKAADRLLRIESSLASSVEIHEMSMAGGVMKMRALSDGLALPAGKTVSLAPGGFHLMIFGTRKAFMHGEKIPLTLHFAKAPAATVMLEVRERPAAE